MGSGKRFGFAARFTPYTRLSAAVTVVLAKGVIVFVVALLSVAADIEPDAISQNADPLEDDYVLAAAFNKWVHDAYSSKPFLEVAPAPGMRWGTFAIRPIKIGQIYSATPWKIIMGERAIRASSKSFYMDHFDIHSALLLFLLYEKSRGTESYYKPYIDILPRTYDTPIHWEDEALELLDGTSMLVSVYEEKHRDKDTFARLKRWVRNNEPDLKDVFDWESYRWAASVLDSRTIHIDGKRNLVPMLDMINCKHHEDVTKIHHTKYDRNIDAAVTPALWNFEKGDQVWENYGQPNHIYYKFHSFIIPNNYHDCLNYLVPADVRAGAKRYIDHHGLRVNLRDSHCISARQISQDLTTSFAVRAYELELGSPSPLKAQQMDMNKGWKLMKKRLLELLKEYPTTTTQDQMLLREFQDEDVQPQPSERHVLAVRYRKLEKELIWGVIRHINENYDRSSGALRDEL